MQEEIWKTIDGFENYQISSLCRVKSKGNEYSRKEKILKPIQTTVGYLAVNLYSKGKVKQRNIHRLFSLYFMPNPENKPQINHKDGIKDNCTPENLEWATQAENTLHAYSKNLISKPNLGKSGKESRMSKPVFKCDLSGNIISKYDSMTLATIDTGIDTGSISRCCQHKVNKTKNFKWEYCHDI